MWQRVTVISYSTNLICKARSYVKKFLKLIYKLPLQILPVYLKSLVYAIDIDNALALMLSYFFMSEQNTGPLSIGTKRKRPVMVNNVNWAHWIEVSSGWGPCGDWLRPKEGKAAQSSPVPGRNTHTTEEKSPPVSGRNTHTAEEKSSPLPGRKTHTEILPTAVGNFILVDIYFQLKFPNPNPRIQLSVCPCVSRKDPYG